MLKKKITANSLLAKSNKAVIAILKMINDLKDTNDAIDVQKHNNAERIRAIEDEQQMLDNLCGNNERIITNFEKLLG